MAFVPSAARDAPSTASPSTSILSRAAAPFVRSPSKKKRLVSPPYFQIQFARSAEKDLEDDGADDSFRPPTRSGHQRINPTTPGDVPRGGVSVNATEVVATGASPEPVKSTDSNMIAAPFGNNARKDTIPKNNGSSAYADMTSVGLVAGLPVATPVVSASSQNPSILYQHIQDMAAKRISTLDYLRKAHEGRVYWFNTVHFSKADLSRLPSFQQAKLSRRATHYMLLGLSIPTLLDIYTANTSSPFEFLRALNTLLMEFEAFQQSHPPDGSTASSLSRARIPQMFKRSNPTKGRRTSSVTDIGLPMLPDGSSIVAGSISENSVSTFSGGSSTLSSSSTQVGTPSTTSIPSSAFDPSAGSEEYTFLLTPSLPFDPDFYETFATLCDVLIDAYTRVISMVSTPAVCSAALGEVFSKADARLRKIIVGGIVREFEDASRASARNEVTGVGRVVLGGLMAQ